MPHARDLLLVGLSYRTAPVEVREGCSYRPQEVAACLDRLRAHDDIDEAWLLSTCNRTEVLLSGSDVEQMRRAVMEERFGRATGEAIYVREGTQAVFHLFRVAAGLDSQVLGESQVLSQIKDALDNAQRAEALGTRLLPLLTQSLVVGKRVRTETRVGEGTLSIARAGVELASKVLGRLSTTKACIVGAGETGLLVARHLSDAGIQKITFLNRTLSRAEAAATEFGGEARPLDDLSKVLGEVNLTVVSVDGSEPILRSEHVDSSRIRRFDRPPMVIDLSVPRAVAPELRDHPDLLVHDLDDLDAVVARHRDERQSEIQAAEGVLVEEVHKFLALRTYAILKPVVSGMKERFESVVEEWLAEKGVSDPAIDRLVRQLTRRLLGETLSQIKDGTRQAFSAENVDRSYRKFLEKT